MLMFFFVFIKKYRISKENRKMGVLENEDEGEKYV